MTSTAQSGSADKKERKTAALLGGVCLFLSALEYMIPKPLPFLRIGIANAPILLGLDLLSLKYFSALTLIKLFGQAIISGTLVSYVFLFSFAGAGASAGIMYLLRRLLGAERISYIGVSTAGAFVSNGVQLILARFFIFGEGVRFLTPPFLGAGLISGVALGLFCETFALRSRWYQERRSA
ncbi:MAG: Gx transporter family protein [Spirochaetaceae bacterium]|jgi:heptaprenyl diphosphate synthase|nr:Gx transporter family protein [Spirochaetaceae bacterium]